MEARSYAGWFDSSGGCVDGERWIACEYRPTGALVSAGISGACS